MNSLRFDYAGARVLVTGGSQGIGLGIARAFLAAGAEVAITGRRASAADYEPGLAGFAYFSLDVRDPEALARVAGEQPRLDVLVNNAGANFPFAPSEWEPAVFEDAVRVNLVGAFRMASACKRLLTASALAGGASVLNVASMAAFRAVPFVPGYAAAKAGIVALTKNLAVAWARDGIRVNAVAPGLIESNMTRAMQGVAALEGPELAKVPLQRWGTPADLAGAFLFLASDAARFITGTTLCVDGGYSST